VKIAVVGCGALGSYYGARLCRDGHEVHFLLRSDYETVRRRGVKVISPEGDFHVNPRAARTPEEIGPCDLVLIGLKTTANSQFPKLLPPLAGPGTAFLTLQNGLGNEAQLAAVVGGEKTLGGLCFVCLNRIEPGVIHHIAHGQIVLGEWKRWPEPRTHDIASAIRHSGVPCKVSDDIDRTHWEKLVWNIPFNGLGVAGSAGYEAVLQGDPEAKATGPCLTSDLLLADPKWEVLLRELMMETIRTAQALGLKVEDRQAQTQIDRTRDMGAYKASTLIDFERGQALEIENLFLEPLRQAKSAGVPTPRLEALCRVLVKLNPAEKTD
jgi:2-dehydropantoate 2-reductase